MTNDHRSSNTNRRTQQHNVGWGLKEKMWIFFLGFRLVSILSFFFPFPRMPWFFFLAHPLPFSPLNVFGIAFVDLWGSSIV